MIRIANIPKMHDYLKRIFNLNFLKKKTCLSPQKSNLKFAHSPQCSTFQCITGISVKWGKGTKHDEPPKNEKSSYKSMKRRRTASPLKREAFEKKKKSSKKTEKSSKVLFYWWKL